MTKPESFTTMFLEGQPGQYHGTLAHAAQLFFLKRLTVSKRVGDVVPGVVVYL